MVFVIASLTLMGASLDRNPIYCYLEFLRCSFVVVYFLDGFVAFNYFMEYLEVPSFLVDTIAATIWYYFVFSGIYWVTQCVLYVFPERSHNNKLS